MEVTLGKERNLLTESPEHCRKLKVEHPILTGDEMEKIRGLDQTDLKTVVLPMLFPASEGHAGLKAAMDKLCQQASQAIEDGDTILVLSDKGMDANYVPIPTLLATAGVHHHLLRERTRTRVGLVVETGEAREMMHFALLIGYGAGAIYPYLAYETVAQIAEEGVFLEKLDAETAISNFIKATRKGLFKITAKMGISTIQSYRGAQVFEVVGLSEKVVDDLMRLRLKSSWGAGLFYMGVSLEGSEALHDAITTIPGSFKKTTQGLERLIAKRKELKSRFPLIHLTCVINQGNVEELVPLYDYSSKLGVDVANYVVNSPATYWHGKDYDQDDHLQRPTAPIEEIEPQRLRTELQRLEEKSQGNKTQLRFSPNYITLDEIVRYYSNESSYKDYRCYIPWTKVAFSAYGDVFSCPHYRVGNINNGSPAWQAERMRGFREKLKAEGIFPGCLGCCQSEYIGPQA